MHCLELLRISIESAAKGKYDSGDKGLFSVEHLSLRQMIDDAYFPIYVSDMDTDEVLYIDGKASEMIGGEKR